jgi:hypothetical protein
MTVDHPFAQLHIGFQPFVHLAISLSPPRFPVAYSSTVELHGLPLAAYDQLRFAGQDRLVPVFGPGPEPTTVPAGQGSSGSEATSTRSKRLDEQNFSQRIWPLPRSTSPARSVRGRAPRPSLWHDGGLLLVCCVMTCATSHSSACGDTSQHVLRELARPSQDPCCCTPGVPRERRVDEVGSAGCSTPAPWSPSGSSWGSPCCVSPRPQQCRLRGLLYPWNRCGVGAGLKRAAISGQAWAVARI